MTVRTDCALKVHSLSVFILTEEQCDNLPEVGNPATLSISRFFPRVFKMCDTSRFAVMPSQQQRL